MRTTVDIDDRVLERAKRAASRAGIALGALVSAALAAFLAPSKQRPAEEPFELLVRGRPGDPFPSRQQLRDADDEDDAGTPSG